MKATSTLVVRDWRKDEVVLVQFPRAGGIVSFSPFCIKMETWLRMTKLKYRNVSNDFTKVSVRGQVPFVELNGVQLADTDAIVDSLSAQFDVGIDRSFTETQKSQAQLLRVLLEDSLYWTIAYFRAQDFAWAATPDGVLGNFSGLKKLWFRRYGVKQMTKGYRRRVAAQGVGRRPPEEVEELAKRDLRILSQHLGNQPYFFGIDASSVDASAFAQLVTITDTPTMPAGVQAFLHAHASNLLAFVDRMKNDFWRDWPQLLASLTLDTSATIAPQK